MAAYIDTTYVSNAIGSTEQQALATGTGLTQLITAASAVVASAFYKAGYTSITATDFVKACTMGALLPMLYGKEGQAMPDTLHAAYLGPLQFLMDSVADGRMPDPGQTVSQPDAVGGSAFTESDPDSTDEDARPQVYRKLRSVY